MNKHYSILILFIFFVSQAFASQLIIDGNYQLRNIFILNVEAPSGVGYCVNEVTVNGDVTTDEINSSAFEIDLSQYGLALGDKVEVQISFKDGCEPKILNPDALKAVPTFEIEDMQIDSDGVLTWVSKNEQGSIPYAIQQYKWNKWVTLGVVDGNGTSNENSYRFKVVPISGKNKVRVVQKSTNGQVRPSKVVSFDSTIKPVEYSYDKKSSLVMFSADTSFEVYDKYGQVIKRGYDSKVDASMLDKGNYYLTYDGATGEFVKR
ncbi:MAG: hypothetical protein ACI8XB_000052 [Patiriisocius sp.]|jgi:hypothetical protein